MNNSTRIRVLIHCRGAGPDLFRTLVSLAGQSTGPRRIHVSLASTRPEEHDGEESRLLHKALDFHAVDVLDASRLHPVQALNDSAAAGNEEWLTLVPEGARLGRRFLARCLEAAADRGVQAVFPLHTAGSPSGEPLATLKPFSPEQLVRTNPVGPVALVRREAWTRLRGLRPAVQLAMWDFWLRLALTGGDIVRVPEILADCRALHRLPPWQDGEAKALLVIGQPGAFEPEVCRWALALLRGDPWARPFEQGRIPSPRDVQAMFAGLNRPRVDEAQLWSDALANPERLPA